METASFSDIGILCFQVASIFFNETRISNNLKLLRVSSPIPKSSTLDQGIRGWWKKSKIIVSLVSLIIAVECLFKVAQWRETCGYARHNFSTEEEKFIARIENLKLVEEFSL